MNKDEEYEYSVPVAHHLNTGTAKVTIFSFFLKDGTKSDIIFFYEGFNWRTAGFTD